MFGSVVSAATSACDASSSASCFRLYQSVQTLGFVLLALFIGLHLTNNVN